MRVGVRARDAAAERRRCVLDAVPPRAAAHGALPARLGAGRVGIAAEPAGIVAEARLAARARACRIAARVMIRDPLPHVARHVVEAPRARRAAPDRPRDLGPAAASRRHPHDRELARITLDRVAPRVARVVRARRGALPLRLGG
jgi:hypothetical protein